ncbi:MAG: xylulokinase [Actinomycetota bacterium]|nr:xylulokinase [Actinomycetota bacterium]
MPDLVLGVDSSTQSTKIEVRDVASGALVGEARASHPPTSPPVSEQDPATWWEALCAAVNSLEELRNDVVAVSIAGQQHGLVALDSSDSVLRPAKLWNDTTSAPEASRLVDRHGSAWWVERVGSVPVASFTVTKVAWMAEHEPDLHRRIDKVMLPHDYLTWRLTGRHLTDRGDASGTGWWSPDGGQVGTYVGEVLDLVGLPISSLPEVVPADHVVGTLTVEAAASLGLRPDVVVGPGTGDNMAAALGLRLRPGDVALSLGTSGTIYAVADRPCLDLTGFVSAFADAAGGFLPLVCTLSATKVTDAVASWLGIDAAELAELALTADAASLLPALVPYFDGERTPNLPAATGTFVGLRTSTTRAQLALAAHDGVICGLLGGYDALREAGVAVGGRVHLIGGGAKSSAYRQRTADLLGSPIVVSHSGETVATGACVQAAVVYTAAGYSRPATDSRSDVFAAVTDRWSLSDGTEVVPSPGVDHPARRAQYTAARDALPDPRPPKFEAKTTPHVENAAQNGGEGSVDTELGEDFGGIGPEAGGMPADR